MLRPSELEQLQNTAVNNLESNYTGEYFAPHKEGAFPDEFFWDTCFIAIGLSNSDTNRAAQLLLGLLRSQWDSGKFPNQFVDQSRRTSIIERMNFGNQNNPDSPNNSATSGISQPPMLAEAVWTVGLRLNKSERTEFFAQMIDPLVKYHSWLLGERRIGNTGDRGPLTQIHPYETGMDNSPPLETSIMENRSTGVRFITSRALGIATDPLINLFRRDLKHAPKEHRMYNDGVLAYQHATNKIRRHSYDMDAILADDAIFLFQDVAYNAICIQNNDKLQLIASELSLQLPSELETGIKELDDAFDDLWYEASQTYFTRNARTQESIKIETIASLLGLYAGNITPERAQILVKSLLDEDRFWTKYPVPSVPINSPHFDQERYWSGPAWEWMNWLIVQGLNRYGYVDVAQDIVHRNLQAAKLHGTGEYRDPITGQVKGVRPFSAADAIIIDFSSNPK